MFMLLLVKTVNGKQDQKNEGYKEQPFSKGNVMAWSYRRFSSVFTLFLVIDRWG